MASKTWQGGNDNWTATAGDWNPNGQPGTGDDVTVAQGDPQISSNVGKINSLTLSSSLDLVTGGALEVATTLQNTGNLNVASAQYTGGATLTVDGTLTNSANFNVGNGGNTSAPVTVMLGALTNTVGLSTGTINLNGNNGSTPEAVSIIVNSVAGFGTGTTLTGNVNLANDASIQFASGSITTIAGQSELTLNGANTSILDANGTPNSALAGLTTVIGSMSIDNGNVLATSGALSNSGTVGVDDMNYAGGSHLTIGGTFTNALQNGATTTAGTLNVGDGNLTSATTVTINGGLTNFVNAVTGTVNVTGNGTNAAVINVGAAAGFGTANTEVGSVNLRGDAQINFTTGTINTVRGTLFLSGAQAAISSDGTDTNSALAGLNLIGPVGSVSLENGNKVTTTGSLSNQNFLGIDDNNYSGGSGLTLGTTGKLTNSGTLDVGNGNLTAATTVSVGTGGLSNFNGTTGTINVSGSTNALAALTVNAAAGFGTAGQLIGHVNLYQDAHIQFATGSISTITNGSELTLAGAGASILDAGGTANSALSGLATVAGQLSIENGPTVLTSAAGGLSDTNFIGVDDGNYNGGSTFGVANTLSNSGTFTVGNGNLVANTTANVGGLTNFIGSTNGTINVDGGPTSQQTGNANEAVINVSGAAGFGTAGQLIGNVNLYQDGQILFTSGQINTITAKSELTLDGGFASVGITGTNSGANNALTGLSTVVGSFSIENGNSVTTGGDLANSGFIGVDDRGYTGGSSLAIGNGTGTFTNTGTLTVGDGNLTAVDSMTVGRIANTGGIINVDGGAINPSTMQANEGLLQVSGAAGFGTAGEIDGNVNLYQDGQIQFANGQIMTIAPGAELTLDGNMAAISNNGSDTNSALTGLSSVVGNLTLRNNASIATGTATAAANTLTIGNTLVDTGSITTPNLDIAAGGTFEIGTGGSVSSAITFAGSTSGTATLAIDATPNSGSTFGNALASFGADDALDLKGLMFADGATATYANGTLTVTSNGVSENFTLTNPSATNYQAMRDASGGTIVSAVTPCYARGTLIRAVRDQDIVDVAVEDLAIGDLVVTAAGARRPIKWLGHRMTDCESHPTPLEVHPIRIAAHAFGEGRPARDLLVSPGHAICVDALGEVLVPAVALVNGATIAQVEVARIEYWHVELDTHDILLAENLPAESYIEVGNRGFFVEAALTTLAAPRPDARPPDLSGYCRPFHQSGRIVELLRTRLETRAEALGWRFAAAGEASWRQALTA